jgi:predicted N-acetyltransferase YhbS
MRIEVKTRSEAFDDFPQIVKHMRSVWPSSDPAETIEADVAYFRTTSRGACERNILLFDADDLVGYAQIFERIITVGSRSIKNMALACVCVRSDCQGHGIGRQIVQKAFEFVDSGEFECSLFQTKVPDFYLRLGARVISNEVINSTEIDKKPFTDPYIMVYPKDFMIGEGRIDLKGYGY